MGSRGPADYVRRLERRLEFLELSVTTATEAGWKPPDGGQPAFVAAEAAALRWALPILRAEAAAYNADAPTRERVRRVYGVHTLPPAVEPYVGVEPGKRPEPAEAAS